MTAPSSLASALAWRRLAAALAIMACLAPRPQAGNLVVNGDFETARDGQLAGWTPPDNLTVFWASGGAPGRCLRLDTDVYRREWEARRGAPEAAPPPKTPTTGTRYDTVAGSVGVSIWSAPIIVEPGAWYLLAADVKGPGGSEPFVYLKGYRELDAAAAGQRGTLRFFKPPATAAAYSVLVGGAEERPARAGDFLQVFRARLVCRLPAGADGWRRFERTVQIRADGPYAAHQVLLMLYAYWPPGEYGFDNISLRRISDAEVEAAKSRRTAHGVPVAP